MRRSVIAAAIGVAVALLLSFADAIRDAHYLPHPSGYFCGSGKVVRLQDHLIDEEIGLYVLMHMLSDKSISFTLSIAMLAILVSAVGSKSKIRISSSVMLFLRNLSVRGWLLAALSSILICTAGAWSSHYPSCFLFASWFINCSPWIGYACCGILLRSIFCHLNAMRFAETHSLAAMILRSWMVAILYAFLPVCWPALDHPISEWAFTVMGFHLPLAGYRFGPPMYCGSSCQAAWLSTMSEVGIILLFLVVYVLIGASLVRCAWRSSFLIAGSRIRSGEFRSARLLQTAMTLAIVVSFFNVLVVPIRDSFTFELSRLRQSCQSTGDSYTFERCAEPPDRTALSSEAYLLETSVANWMKSKQMYEF